MAERYIMVTDQSDRIIQVNEEWIVFARENWRPDFSQQMVLAQRLWDFVSDKATRYVYSMVMQRARERGHPLCFPFRCDSPRMRRSMSMTLRPLPEGGMEWASLLLEEQPRQVALPTIPAGPGSGQPLLKVCSWCLLACAPVWLPRREGAPKPGAWVEMEDLMASLASHLEGHYPHLTHGICPACFQRISSLIDAAQG